MMCTASICLNCQIRSQEPSFCYSLIQCLAQELLGLFDGGWGWGSYKQRRDYCCDEMCTDGLHRTGRVIPWEIYSSHWCQSQLVALGLKSPSSWLSELAGKGSNLSRWNISNLPSSCICALLPWGQIIWASKSLVYTWSVSKWMSR